MTKSFFIACGIRRWSGLGWNFLLHLFSLAVGFFMVFLIGAISSAVGGYVGFKPRKIEKYIL